MSKSKTISKDDNSHESLDFERLFQLGIAHTEQLSGEVWTDYNPHDPGVTMLEYLCFAITDLGYRTNFSIEDILFSNLTKDRSVNNAFFAAHDILPNAPLTDEDYRKLLIDRIPNVQNAWLKPVKDRQYHYQGVYQVYLQVVDNENISDEIIIQQASDLLHAHRNLCEDIATIKILKQLPFYLEADIHLNNDVIPEQVFATIIYELEQFLNPAIKRYSKEELLAEGYTYDTIYDGPTLYHGQIKSTSFKELAKEIYLDRVQDLLTEVDGVGIVESFTVYQNSAAVKQDILKVEEESYYVLDSRVLGHLDHPPSVRFYKNGLPVTINIFQTQQIIHSLALAQKNNLKAGFIPSFSNKDTLPPIVDLFKYMSIQQLFPHIYGIGSYGLPIGSSPIRRQQAKQLKGYLSLFEIFLSSYLKQLSQVRYLFDINANKQKSYFVQFPQEIPDIHTLIKTPAGVENKKQHVQEQLDKITQEFDRGGQRINQFMDHLLARFGVSNPVESHPALFSSSGEERYDQIIAAKQKILRNYCELSSRRAVAFNYTQAAWETDNVSTLKKRICTELLLPQIQNTPLAQTFTVQGFQWGQHTKTNRPKRWFNLKEMLSLGTQRKRFFTEKKAGKNHIYFQPSGQLEPYLLFTQEEQEDNEATIHKFIAQLQQMNTDSKGFFIVEHLLLRPQQIPQWQLKIGRNQEEPLLVSIENTDIKTQEYLVDDLLLMGTKPTNYSILKHQIGYRILLKYDGQPVMISPIDYATKKTAEQAVENFIIELENIKNTNPTAIESLIYLEREVIPGWFINSRFYESRLSIIIPNWNATFQDTDFRQLFEYTVAQHLPTHIGVDFHWFNFARMSNFESLYKKWLQTKQSETVDTSQLDQLSLALIKLLKGEQFIKDSLPKNKPHNIIDESLRSAIIKDVTLSRLFDPENFDIIIGVTTKIEKILKAGNIKNWERFAMSSIDRIQFLLRREGIRANAIEISKWIRQAQLGVQNRWQELYDFQQPSNFE